MADEEEKKGSAEKRAYLRAKQCLEDKFGHKAGIRLRLWRGSFWEWVDGRYIPVSKDDVNDRVHMWALLRFPEVTKYATADLVQSVRSLCHLDSNIDWPHWIGKPGDRQPAEPGRIVAVRNGILDLSRRFAGKGYALQPLTPLFFSPVRLPFNYDPAAVCPEWEKFVLSANEGDQQRIDLLQEWFGLCLTADTHYQKMMVLAGLPRSGKGVTLRTLQALVGKENTAACTFPRLTYKHTLSDFHGKTLVVFADAHLDKALARTGVVETLKAITGEDTQPIERKYKEAMSEKLNVHIVIGTNEELALEDHTGGLASRIMILPFRETWEGREDLSLEDRIRPEMSGILNWALRGLERLDRNERFTRPSISEAAIHQFRVNTTPVRHTLKACLKEEPGSELPSDSLYTAYVAACERMETDPVSQARVGKEVRLLFPKATTRRINIGATKKTIYQGIALLGAVDEA